MIDTFLLHRQSIKKSLLQGFAISFTSGLIYLVYAAGWRLAAFLVTQNRIGIVEVFR